MHDDASVEQDTPGHQETTVYFVRDGIFATSIAVLLNSILALVLLTIARFLLGFGVSENEKSPVIMGLILGTGGLCFVLLNASILLRIAFRLPAVVVTTHRVRVWRGYCYRDIPLAAFRGAGVWTYNSFVTYLRIYFSTDKPSTVRAGEPYPGITVGTATFKRRTRDVMADLNGVRKARWQGT